jgi:hypothetical protein
MICAMGFIPNTQESTGLECEESKLLWRCASLIEPSSFTTANKRSGGCRREN